MSALTGLAKFKDIFFKANKIDPKKTETVESLLVEKIGLSERQRPKNPDSFITYVDELPKNEDVYLTSSKIKDKKIDVNKLTENLYERLQNKKGYLDPGTISTGNLRKVSKAYNLEKAYVEQDAAARDLVLSYFNKRPEIFKKDFEGIKSLGLVSEKTIEKFKPLYDFYNTETKVKTPSTQAIIENIVTKKYPAKNFYESMKLFKAENPGVNSEFDFLVKNKNEIDKISESFFNKKPLNVVQDNIRHLIYSSKIFNRKQKQSLMSEARKKGELTKIKEPEVSAPQFVVRDTTKLVQKYAPETIIDPRSSLGFYQRGMRNELVGNYLPGLTPKGTLMKSPAEQFNIHHPVNKVSLIEFQKYNLLGNLLPQTLKYPNLMVLSKMTNETLKRFESYSNTILRQILKDYKSYEKIKNKQSDEALNILNRIEANNAKFKQIELTIPENYRFTYNPLVKKRNKLEFKPLKQPIREFVGPNPEIAFQTGLIKGLEREGIPKKKLLNATDRVYKLLLDELKRGKFKKTQLLPSEQLKLKKGGIVGLQNIKA
jgi:hypothetical protein